MGVPAGHRLRVTGAQRQRGLRDELNVLGIGLRQVECAGTRCGYRVGRGGGVDGDAVVIEFRCKAFREPVQRRLDRAVDPESGSAVELGERRALGQIMAGMAS